MPISRLSSNTPDLADVVMMLSAFEELSTSTIEVTCSTTKHKGVIDLQLSAQAWSDVSADGGRTLLGSASVLCLSERYISLSSALTYLLYRLDYEIEALALKKLTQNS